ncbi:unnamed protein product, partial [Mesorhabditis spiculigera]
MAGDDPAERYARYLELLGDENFRVECQECDGHDRCAKPNGWSPLTLLEHMAIKHSECRVQVFPFRCEHCRLGMMNLTYAHHHSFGTHGRPHKVRTIDPQTAFKSFRRDLLALKDEHFEQRDVERKAMASIMVAMEEQMKKTAVGIPADYEPQSPQYGDVPMEDAYEKRRPPPKPRHNVGGSLSYANTDSGYYARPRPVRRADIRDAGRLDRRVAPYPPRAEPPRQYSTVRTPYYEEEQATYRRPDNNNTAPNWPPETTKSPPDEEYDFPERDAQFNDDEMPPPRQGYSEHEPTMVEDGREQQQEPTRPDVYQPRTPTYVEEQEAAEQHLQTRYPLKDPRIWNTPMTPKPPPLRPPRRDDDPLNTSFRSKTSYVQQNGENAAETDAAKKTTTPAAAGASTSQSPAGQSQPQSATARRSARTPPPLPDKKRTGSTPAKGTSQGGKSPGRASSSSQNEREPFWMVARRCSAATLQSTERGKREDSCQLEAEKETT